MAAADGVDYGAQDREHNRAFRDAARRAYGGDGARRAAQGAARARAAAANAAAAEEALRKLTETLGGPPGEAPSQIPPQVRGRVVVVGRAPGVELQVTGDPFAGQRHARITEVHAPGTDADGTVWVEVMEPGRATRVRRPDGTLDEVRDRPVRVRPGDVLVCGVTEIPWRVKG